MSEQNHNLLLLTFARRGEERAIHDVLASLRELFPGARLIAVGTPVSEPVLRELGMEHILVYGNGKTARQVIEEAQLFMPEAAAIIYDDPTFSAHLKLEALALIVGARAIYRCLPEGGLVRLRRVRLALSVLVKGIRMALCFAAAAALTALACTYLCWYGRSRGGRRAGGT